MTKISTFLTLTAIAISSLAVKQAFTYSSGPPDAHTNAPGEGVCRDCHAGPALNSGTAFFNIHLVDTISRYVPGETYTLEVGFLNTSHTTNGFQLTAIGDNGANGTLIASDQVNTQISTSGGKQYLKHTTAGHNNHKTWTFQWKAPVAGSGGVRFWAAGNNANGNGNNTGDSIYTEMILIPEGIAVAVKSSAIEGGSLAAFPNPAKGMSNVSFSLKFPTEARLALYDLQGKKVHHQQLGTVAAGKHTERFDIPAGVRAGTYILRLEAGNKASALRMNIL